MDREKLRQFERKEKIESTVKWTGIFLAALVIIGIAVNCIVYLSMSEVFLVEWIAIAGLGVGLAIISILSFFHDRRDLREFMEEAEAELAEMETEETAKPLKELSIQKVI